METLIKNINDFKSSQMVLVPFPGINKDLPGFVLSVSDTHKYPISDVGGTNKRRNYRDDNDNLCSITAESEGCQGDEMIKQVSIMYDGGSLTLNELHDIESFNVRSITEEHPLYDKNIAENANMMGGFFGAMAQLDDDIDEDSLGSAMMKVLGGMMKDK